MSFCLLKDADAPAVPLSGSRGAYVLGGLLAGAITGLMGACAAPEKAVRR